MLHLGFNFTLKVINHISTAGRRCGRSEKNKLIPFLEDQAL